MAEIVSKKKKILVAGAKQNIVMDFINHSDIYFKTLSTTSSWNDLSLHFELFEPDGYLLFPDSSDDDMVSQINKLKSEDVYNDCPIFICAPMDVCAVIQRTSPRLVDLMLKRPVSADNLSLRIMKYYEDLAKQKEKEAQRLAALSAAQSPIDYVDPNKADGPAQEERKKSILIVDDDKTILKMLKSALEEHYDVTAMVNGVLVKKYLDTKPADLILLDYEMPIKTGADVMRDIRSDDKYKDIPICFLTGVAERDKILEILSLNPAAYMLKPVNMEALIATISNLID